MAVFRCPATGTMLVACGSRVDQQGPRKVDALFGTDRFLVRPADQDAVDEEIAHQGLAHLRVGVAPQLEHELVPLVVLVFHYLAEELPLLPIGAVPVDFVRPAKHAAKILFRIAVKEIDTHLRDGRRKGILQFAHMPFLPRMICSREVYQQILGKEMDKSCNRVQKIPTPQKLDLVCGVDGDRISFFFWRNMITGKP